MLNYKVVYKNELGITESLKITGETVNEIVITVYKKLKSINAEIIQLNWIESN